MILKISMEKLIIKLIGMLFLTLCRLLTFLLDGFIGFQKLVTSARINPNLLLFLHQ